MKSISIYTITSPLHDEKAIESATREFLGGLCLDFDFKGENFSDYGTASLDLIYVRSGGTEEVFLKNLPDIERSGKPIYLLTSGKSNSLAASMEILSYLRQKGLKGEIIHGEASVINNRIKEITSELSSSIDLHARLGVIGKPSNWLISSGVDYNAVKDKFGVELIDIPIQKLIEKVNALNKGCSDTLGMGGAENIYKGLKELITEENLNGLTIRCFDLLTAVKNTGCLALAKLNSEGYVAGCEGDIPAALSMLIARKVLGVSGFQANPAKVNVKTSQVLFAHCTIPLSMVESYELTTHFESGIGVAIRGFMKKGPVTVFKVSGDLSRSFIEEGELLENGCAEDLCRTQQLIRLNNPQAAKYFLTNPIGNHHIILEGHCKNLLNLNKF